MTEAPYHMNAEEIAKMQKVVDRFLNGKEELDLLEAGCGSRSHLRIPSHARVTGMDLSKRQLEKNSDLHEKILGDLQTHELPASRFDIIVCWDVLEHLPYPQKALENFVKALKPGGILVLAVPNVFSLKSLIAKWTPYGFHVWVYRTLLHDDTAGIDGNSPYPTYHRFSIAPGALQKSLEKRGLKTEYFSMYESEFQKENLREKYPPIHFFLAVFGVLAGVFSLNKIKANLTDCLCVFSKGCHFDERP